MKQENVREIQLNVYEIFKEFDLFCKEHNLRYYMLGGTMLGAVRHKGFIPWDDDMDVGMPREDYEQFLSMGKTFFVNEKGKLLNGKWERNFSFDFSKIMRVINICGSPLEVFLDIFPLDGCPKTNSVEKKQYYQRFDMLRMMKNAHVANLKEKRGIRKILIFLLRLIPIRVYRKIMNKYLMKNSFERSPFVGNFSGHWEEKEIMQKEIYGNPTLIQFEGEMYYGVENSHAYLSNLYGDYMKLPPLEEQLSHFS